MKRILLAIALALAMVAPVYAQSVSQAIRIEDSTAHAIVGATVTIYVHGQSHIPANVIATGVTDSDGYVQPAPALIPGTEYDFVTTDGRVPSGVFTAIAPTQLQLISGHGSTQTSALVTMVPVGTSVSVPVYDGTAFPVNSFAALIDTAGHAAYGQVTANTGSTLTLLVQTLAGGASSGTQFATNSTVTFTGQPVTAGCSSNCAVNNADNNFATVQSFQNNVQIIPAGTATSGANFASAGAVKLESSGWNGTAAVTHYWTMTANSSNVFNFGDDINGVDLSLTTGSGGGTLSTGNTSIGPKAFTLGGSAAKVAQGIDTSAGLGGSWNLGWFTNESGPDEWAWYVNGSNGGGGLASHSLSLYYYPHDTAVGSSFSAISIVPNGSNHDALNASNGSITFSMPASFGATLSSAGAISSATGGISVGGTNSTLSFASANNGLALLFQDANAHATQLGPDTSGASIDGVACGLLGIGYNTVGYDACYDTVGNYAQSGAISAAAFYAGARNGAGVPVFEASSGNVVVGCAGSTQNCPLLVYTAGVGTASTLSVDHSGNQTLSGTLTTGGTITINGNNNLVVNGSAMFGAPGSGTTVQGVGCATAGIAQSGVAWRWCIDNSSNVGIGGNVYATNFFNGSRAAWKKNITPYKFDALDVVAHHVHYAEYDCRTDRCGPIGVHKVGIIADDSAPQVAGPKHDHYDGFAMAALDGKAISELVQRFDGLERLMRALCKQKQNRKVKECARVR